MDVEGPQTRARSVAQLRAEPVDLARTAQRSSYIIFRARNKTPEL